MDANNNYDVESEDAEGGRFLRRCPEWTRRNSARAIVTSMMSKKENPGVGVEVIVEGTVEALELVVPEDLLLVLLVPVLPLPALEVVVLLVLVLEVVVLLVLVLEVVVLLDDVVVLLVLVVLLLEDVVEVVVLVADG